MFCVVTAYLSFLRRNWRARSVPGSQQLAQFLELLLRHETAANQTVRTATSLARRWRDQGKRTEARDLLAPIYGWFTEGFDAPVL
jgi:hypothetical protein